MLCYFTLAIYYNILGFVKSYLIIDKRIANMIEETYMIKRKSLLKFFNLLIALAPIIVGNNISAIMWHEPRLPRGMQEIKK
jgi:hypothetical protein